MRILVDENIPYAKEAFSCFGQVVTLAGREITRQHLQDVEILLVRSITVVNAALLEGTPVRFVGTATIGTDHIDIEYLHRKGIGFVSAPGCNANAVAEYVLAALLSIDNLAGLQQKTVGIIGYGYVGKAVEIKMQALGIACLINDPLLQQAGYQKNFVCFDEVLAADIISCHVPLTISGEWPTQHLFNKSILQQLKPDTILVNTARGAVIDNQALLNRVKQQSLHVILDVWENEPVPNTALIQHSLIATPHIAGYSFEGKVNATVVLHQALLAFLQSTVPAWQPLLPEPAALAVPENQQQLVELLKQVYDIQADNQRFRDITKFADNAEKATFFDRLRKHYPLRREFSAYRLNAKDTSISTLLNQLGFN